MNIKKTSRFLGCSEMPISKSISDIKELKQKYQEYKPEIKSKLNEFSKLSKNSQIKELFFCLLTPQSRAEKCWQAVKEMENCENEESIKNCLKTKTRFHNNKAGYILNARNNWKKIENIINSNKNPRETRTKLVEEVKGLGMKEASHFLRNIGKSDNHLAILDRHILRKLIEMKIIQDIKLNNKIYLEIEQKMEKFSKEIGIPLDELDLLFWKIESGRIFK